MYMRMLRSIILFSLRYHNESVVTLHPTQWQYNCNYEIIQTIMPKTADRSFFIIIVWFKIAWRSHQNCLISKQTILFNGFLITTLQDFLQEIKINWSMETPNSKSTSGKKRQNQTKEKRKKEKNRNLHPAINLHSFPKQDCSDEETGPGLFKWD